MMLTLVVLLVVLTIWRKLRRRRATYKLTQNPLAGMDTGVRSPFRAPVRFPRGF